MDSSVPNQPGGGNVASPTRWLNGQHKGRSASIMGSHLINIGSQPSEVKLDEVVTVQDVHYLHVVSRSL